MMRFFIYGFTGLMIEILWTGAHSFVLEKDCRLLGRTSLWMFPVYGMVVCFEPLCDLLFGLPIVVRGGIYTVCYFTVEYLSGWWFKKILGRCPWDYSDSPWNIHGLIRLDYAPLWFAAGLFFETLSFFLR